MLPLMKESPHSRHENGEAPNLSPNVLCVTRHHVTENHLQPLDAALVPLFPPVRPLPLVESALSGNQRPLGHNDH